MPTTPEAIITLNCFALGGGSMDVFSVKIDKTETVLDLKESIKNKKPTAFRGVDADTLVLWEVPRVVALENPTPSPYHKQLINVTRAGLGEPLKNTHLLSELFVAPLAKGRIHIIVDAPSPEICCWLRGAEVENNFVIRISANAHISLLAEQIKVAKLDPSAVVDNSIRLYKVSADDDDKLRESLRSPGAGHRLNGRRRISTSFLDVPVLQDYYVIVEFATESPASMKLVPPLGPSTT
ncbi:hypothetical protein BDN67DRAFT_815836 [Paxillus ammoniavirescens]|nr:hypothetical protein BDN67DRAFT_815836 [Paxillus ammoniavirescens]